jgi:hypothetical protein
MPEPISIRELFQSDDVVGQWTYSLSVLCDDLGVITSQLRPALEEGHLRETLFFARQLFIRIYEARRLITVMEAHPEIETFAFGQAHEHGMGRFLLDVYRAKEGQKMSLVEDAYGRFRHQTVHLMWPGSDELEAALDTAGWLPARIWVSEGQVVNQWVQAVSGMLLFGDVQDPDWMHKFVKLNELAGRISSAWLMLFSTTLVLYARRRGIDLERLRVAEE